jgi:hypothetical protein
MPLDDEARNCAALKNVIREGLRVCIQQLPLGSLRETARFPVPDLKLIVPKVMVLCSIFGGPAKW